MSTSTLEIPRPIKSNSVVQSLWAKHFAGGFGSTLLAQMVVLGLGTFTGIAAARLLGPQGRGELAALILWPSVLVMLFSLGINQAIVFHTGQNHQGISEVGTAAALIGLAQSLAVVLVGLLVIPLALHRYSPEVRHWALIFLFSAPFLMFSGYPANLLQGKLDFRSFNAIRTIAPLCYALGLAILLMTTVAPGFSPAPFKLRQPHVLPAVVAFQILGYVLALAGGCWILWRKVALRFSLQKQVVKSLLSFGWKTQVASVTSYINQRVDQLLLSLLVSPRELGLYVVAVTVSLALGFLPQASAIVTLAAGSNLPRADARAVIAHSFRTSLVWLVAGCTALFVVAPGLITLVFGPGFAASGLACRILLPGSIALGLNQVLYEGARSMNDPALPSYSEGWAAVLTCVGLYLLLPRFGFLGAAIASTAAYTSSLAFTLALYRWRLRFPVRELFGAS
jgi:O-antigen/teichoic acid export membrane protein